MQAHQAPMERVWLILSKYLRVVKPETQVGHRAAAVVQSGSEAEQLLRGVDMEAAAFVHQGTEAEHAFFVGTQPQVEQLLAEPDRREEAAFVQVGAKLDREQLLTEIVREPAAAVPDFIVSAEKPPHITFVTVRIALPGPPAEPDKKPFLLATGPFRLLAHFAAVPPTDEPKAYYFDPHVSHLVVVRHFHLGADDGTFHASAHRVPDRNDDIPKLTPIHASSIGFLCDREQYTIAELRVEANSALLICYSSDLDAWSSSPLDAPLERLDGEEYRRWTPHGAVAVDTTVTWFDLSWGLLRLDFSPPQAEYLLEFSSLPPGRRLGTRDATAINISRRCIAVSGTLVRYVEIVDGNGEAPTVSMWYHRRGVDAWEWVLNYCQSFEEIWNDESYSDTGLPRKTPRLAAVCPVNPNLIYSTLDKRVFGVNVPEHQVVGLEKTERNLGSSDLLTWTICADKEFIVGHVPPNLQEEGDELPD